MLRHFALVLCAAPMLVASGGAHGFTITRDNGGRIGAYVDRYGSLRDSGEKVVIDGTCASACTIVLGAIPRERLCATPRARLGFHQAYNLSDASHGSPVRAVANPEASAYLLSLYPEPIRRWIRGHKGLPAPAQMLWLRGKALARLVPRCPATGRLPALY